MNLPLKYRSIALSSIIALLLSFLRGVDADPQVPQRAWIVPRSIPQRPLILATKNGQAGTCPSVIVWSTGEIVWKDDWEHISINCQCEYLVTQPSVSRFVAMGYNVSVIAPEEIEVTVNAIRAAGVFTDRGQKPPLYIETTGHYSIVVQHESDLYTLDGSHRLVEAGSPVGESGWVMEARGPRRLNPGETLENALQDEPIEYLRYRYNFSVVETEISRLIGIAQQRGGYSHVSSMEFERRNFPLPSARVADEPGLPSSLQLPAPAATAS